MSQSFHRHIFWHLFPHYLVEIRTAMVEVIVQTGQNCAIARRACLDFSGAKMSITPDGIRGKKRQINPEGVE